MNDMELAKYTRDIYDMLDRLPLQDAADVLVSAIVTVAMNVKQPGAGDALLEYCIGQLKTGVAGATKIHRSRLNQ